MMSGHHYSLSKRFSFTFGSIWIVLFSIWGKEYFLIITNRLVSEFLTLVFFIVVFSLLGLLLSCVFMISIKLVSKRSLDKMSVYLDIFFGCVVSVLLTIYIRYIFNIT